MPDYDAGFKIVARNAGPGLTRLAGVACDELISIGDAIQTTERLADRAFRARKGARQFIVYMEAYTRWTDDAVWSILTKSALLSERERLATRSLVFILLPQGYKPQHGQFRLEVEGGEPTQQVWFREICLWMERPEPWWEQSPGLMSLYPLCDHRMELTGAISHAADAIRRTERDVGKRADLLTILGVFGKLKNRAIDTVSIIGRNHMKESPLYQEIMLEGGQIQVRRDILQILEVKFGAKNAKEFATPLNRLESLAELQELHKTAIRSRSIGQFRRALPGKTNGK